MYNKQEIGKKGETIAAEYLEKNHYKIIQRNYRCKIGEIDIIAFDKKENELAFIEVKTRTTIKYGMPKEAVNKNKQKHIYNIAQYYLICKKLEYIYCRIDVIEILVSGKKYKINHLKRII